MSDSSASQPEAKAGEGAKKKGKLGSLVLFLVIGLASAGGGFAVPMLVPGLVGHAAAPGEGDGHGEEGGAGEGAGGGHGAPAAHGGGAKDDGHGEHKDEKPVFITFDQLIVNLNSDRFNRFLKLAISLQVDEKNKELVTTEMEAKKVRIKSWLISYLSDKELEEIRGAAGQNRLRREILTYFNTELFDDGFDRVSDVLFEEFNVQ